MAEPDLDSEDLGTTSPHETPDNISLASGSSVDASDSTVEEIQMQELSSSSVPCIEHVQRETPPRFISLLPRRTYSAPLGTMEEVEALPHHLILGLEDLWGVYRPLWDYVPHA